jgi:hypothetical protein
MSYDSLLTLLISRFCWLSLLKLLIDLVRACWSGHVYIMYVSIYIYSVSFGEKRKENKQ